MALDQIVYVLLFLVPAYVSNSIPVLLGGGLPLDFGMVLPDKERLFGEGKTIRGFIAGVFGGTTVGGLIALYFQFQGPYAFPFFHNPQAQFLGGFVLALGAISGDALGSFIKRRLHLTSGKPFLLDTVLFIIIALALAYPFVNPGFYTVFNISFCIALSALLHPLTNMLANKVGLKKVPW